MILRGGKKKPFKINELTEHQKLAIENDPSFYCGTSFLKTKIFILPSFCFEASCDLHDLFYRRGGGILDKIEADLDFYFLMISDILRKQDALINSMFYCLMATAYFFAVSIFGLFSFNWGLYKTFDEIMKN